MKRKLILIAVLIAGMTKLAWGVVVPPPALNPLNQITVPEPPQLYQFVKNKNAAVRLGKAFFWDMQVGSDGIQACASCHFHAGADNRVKNTLNPGTRGGDTTFQVKNPGETLQPSDFPFHKRAQPDDVQSSAVISDANDIVGSQGVRFSEFVDITPGSAVDVQTQVSDPVFNMNGANTRRVTARQAPSVINAIFNFVNFWDGRAGHEFNGENVFGPADPNAGVWFNEPVNGLVKKPVTIQFASLASQATGPALDDTEMSAKGRTFPKLGKKLLSLTPLGKQLVHPKDSLLGVYSKAVIGQNGELTGMTGISETYGELIKDAFKDNLWNSNQLTPQGFTQMEANFSLFWGLAIQLYEAKLVSDDTPFDRWLAGDQTALTEEQKQGFSVFSGVGNCTVCHAGIELSNATFDVAAFVSNVDNNLFEVMFVADGRQVIYDSGYNNTSVRKTTDDIGRGAKAPFINPLTGEQYPLSFSERGELQAQGKLPFEAPLLPLFVPKDFPVNVMGSFKVPDLRNVELTAPYFHNGGTDTLDEVVDFYTRGGNFPVDNIHDLDPDILTGIPSANGDQTLHNSLVAFLKSLTDQRVVNESDPFDHPELIIPAGDDGGIEIFNRILAKDRYGNPAPPAVLIINSPPAVTRSDSLTITGIMGEGLIPAVTVDPPASAANLVIGSTDWSVQVNDLAEGLNTVEVSVVDQQNIKTTLTANILLDTTPPELTLSPVISPTGALSQTISGTMETGVSVMVSVNGGETLPAYTWGTKWSFVAALSSSQANNILVTATDKIGNSSARSETIIYGSGAPIQPSPACGNSILESGEVCEDGNKVDSDGCNALCQIELDTPDNAVPKDTPDTPASGGNLEEEGNSATAGQDGAGGCSLIIVH